MKLNRAKLVKESVERPVSVTWVEIRDAIFNAHVKLTKENGNYTIHELLRVTSDYLPHGALMDAAMRRKY